MSSEPALPRSLRCDLVLCCGVKPYSVLSTTVAIPQRCHRSRHRHRHPRRRAAAAATAAAAVRRLLCCGCGWCLLRFFLKILLKNWLFCCGDDRDDRARPSCCAATHLARPSPPPPPPPPLLLRLRLRLRCCYCAAAAAAVLLLCCCLSDGVVLGLPLLVSLGATAPCLDSKFDVASLLPACGIEAVYKNAFSAVRPPQTQPKACRSESGLSLAWRNNFS